MRRPIPSIHTVVVTVVLGGLLLSQSDAAAPNTDKSSKSKPKVNLRKETLLRQTANWELEAPKSMDIVTLKPTKNLASYPHDEQPPKDLRLPAKPETGDFSKRRSTYPAPGKLSQPFVLHKEKSQREIDELMQSRRRPLSYLQGHDSEDDSEDDDSDDDGAIYFVAKPSSGSSSVDDKRASDSDDGSLYSDNVFIN
ncbi:hypothetical protein FOL47_006898 [Perkinsus chesapeaki]|uniref:Uncharacterized protein n=1 Tax=Perkinsus chesapeaki TaxID=330153 RepID=A0A7J6LP16_PERCH|nr:hypothetical protein FOL47_006898 [Perkinsus chesapeaki]